MESDCKPNPMNASPEHEEATCAKCGHRLHGGARFCARCGEPAPVGIPTPVVTELEPAIVGEAAPLTPTVPSPRKVLSSISISRICKRKETWRRLRA